MKLKDSVRHSENYPTRSPDREANERFVHLRNLPYPGEGVGLKGDRTVTNVTAFVRNIDGTEYVSFAECDSRDQFCRRTGRVIARRKWFNEKRTPLLEGTRGGTDPGGNSSTLYDRVLDTYYETSGAIEVPS